MIITVVAGIRPGQALAVIAVQAFIPTAYDARAVHTRLTAVRVAAGPLTAKFTRVAVTHYAITAAVALLA